MSLPKEVFGLEANHELLSLSYRASLAEDRSAGAKTLRRGEVRGGGKKPWRQKGTGRARVGSRRNPVWTGGGVAFGPLGIENYSIGMTKKMKRIAIAQALSIQSAENRVAVIESFDVKDGKTSSAAKLLAKVGEGRMLIVLDSRNDSTDRALRNLANVVVVSATYLNARNILDPDLIVFTKAALDKTVAWLSGKEIKPVAKPAPKEKVEAKK